MLDRRCGQAVDYSQSPEKKKERDRDFLASCSMKSPYWPQRKSQNNDISYDIQCSTANVEVVLTDAEASF